MIETQICEAGVTRTNLCNFQETRCNISLKCTKIISENKSLVFKLQKDKLADIRIFPETFTFNEIILIPEKTDKYLCH